MNLINNELPNIDKTISNPDYNSTNPTLVNLTCEQDASYNTTINLVEAIQNLDITNLKNAPMNVSLSGCDTDQSKVKPPMEIKAPDMDGNGNIDLKEWDDAISLEQDDNDDGIIDFTQIPVKSS